MFKSILVHVGVLLICFLFLSACSSGNTDTLANVELGQAVSEARFRVTSSRNDAEEVNKTVYLRSKTLNFGAAGAVGVRFEKVNIPKDAVIESAYIEFKAGASKRGKLTLNIRGDDSSSAKPFRTTKRNLSSRAKTSTSVLWTPRAWTMSQTVSTPELNRIVQEIVGRDDWSSGNAIAFMISGSGGAQRTAASYDRSGNSSPTLVVSFRNSEHKPDQGPPTMSKRDVIRTPLQAGVPQLLFGQGPVGADRLREADFVARGNLRMLTTWYNGPNDLNWQRGYKANFVPTAYEEGYALHLVVFSGDAEKQFDTVYGTACGRPYPLSPGFLSDIQQLADIWAGTVGSPPLYFTMFTEFQTYACSDNAWRPDEKVNNYYKALKDVYQQSKQIIYEAAPNAVVSIGWGGWQSFDGNVEIGQGSAMIPYFSDIMNASDFVSIQAMDSHGKNPTDIQNMVATINREAPGKPIMVAHYKPDDKNQDTFRNDLKNILNDEYVNELNRKGVFAFSFMDDENQKFDHAFYENFILPAVRRYSKMP